MNKTTGIYKAINSLSEKINDLTRNLDAYYGIKSETNADNINVNAGGLDNLAETTDTGLTALDELAEYVSGLESRIEALENKEA